MDQIKQIFALLGTPNDDDWPGWDRLPYFKTFKVRSCCCCCCCHSLGLSCALLSAFDTHALRKAMPKVHYTLPHPNQTQTKPPQVAPGKPSQLRQRFPRVNLGAGPMLSDTGFDLLSRMLTLNPQRRITAKEALDHDWFREGPLPAQQKIMPTFPSRAARE